MSSRVHSRYERRLLDTAAGGCEVVICLVVRRFRCLAADCPKATFAEQVDGLACRHARRTPAVTAVLQAVALALGGRAGARLSGRGPQLPGDRHRAGPVPQHRPPLRPGRQPRGAAGQ